VWGTGGFPDPVALVDATGADGSAGIDPYYYLKDALGSVGALTNASGAVVERYVYTPYGDPMLTSAGGSVRTESLYGNPFLWTGQRYEASTMLYHFWARTYSPELGRFLQEDEQGPLSPVDVSLFGGGSSPTVSPPSTNAGGEYIDGLMLYLYAGANPTNLRDPFGLSNDEYDDLMDDLTGHKLYALAQLNEGAKWASLGLQTASDIALSLLPGWGLYEAYRSGVKIYNGRGGLMDYLQVGLGTASNVVYAVKAVKLIGKAVKWIRRADKGADVVSKFKVFTKGYFRHNLKVRTGISPPSNVHAHHILPDEFATHFRARGINHNDPKFGAWWPGGEHLAAHGGGYNRRWMELFTRSNPTADEVLEFGRRLAGEFGLDIAF